MVLSFDVKNAFKSMSRNAIRKSLADRTPALSRVAGAWHSSSSSHVFWDDCGVAWTTSDEDLWTHDHDSRRLTIIDDDSGERPVDHGEDEDLLSAVNGDD